MGVADGDMKPATALEANLLLSPVEFHEAQHARSGYTPVPASYGGESPANLTRFQVT